MNFADLSQLCDQKLLGGMLWGMLGLTAQQNINHYSREDAALAILTFD